MKETGVEPIVIEEICDIARKYNVQKVFCLDQEQGI